MNTLTKLFLVGFAMAVAACGGDDGGGSGFSTGVSGSKKLDQLSASETQQLCSDLEEWGQEVVENGRPKLCRIAGIFAEDEAQCEMLVQECINEPDEPTPGMCEAPDNCSATVAEVQKCLDDAVVEFNKLLDQFPTCKQIASGMASVPVSQPQQPASCKAIESTCPDVSSIFEDIDADLDEED